MSDLVHIERELPAVPQAQGGRGLNFSPKLQPKPATITINEPMTQVAGATLGMFRVVETGQEFDHMDVVLLAQPREQRAYHGPMVAGKLNRRPENLMCYAFEPDNGIWKPSEKAKVPQALQCSNCPNADWRVWEKTRAKADIPPCDLFWYVVMIDTVLQIPLQFYVRATNKKPFEKGLQNIIRTFSTLVAEAERDNVPLPNLWDLQFTIATEKAKGDVVNYILKIDPKKFKVLTPETSTKFGILFENYANRGKTAQEAAQEAAVAEVESSSQAVNAVVETVVTEEGEIVI